MCFRLLGVKKKSPTVLASCEPCNNDQPGTTRPGVPEWHKIYRGSQLLSDRLYSPLPRKKHMPQKGILWLGSTQPPWVNWLPLSYYVDIVSNCLWICISRPLDQCNFQTPTNKVLCAVDDSYFRHLQLVQVQRKMIYATNGTSISAPPGSGTITAEGNRRCRAKWCILYMSSWRHSGYTVLHKIKPVHILAWRRWAQECPFLTEKLLAATDGFWGGRIGLLSWCGLS